MAAKYSVNGNPIQAMRDKRHNIAYQKAPLAKNVPSPYAQGGRSWRLCLEDFRVEGDVGRHFGLRRVRPILVSDAYGRSLRHAILDHCLHL